MRHVGLGQALLALGLMGLGVLTAAYGDFALQWQPVPSWLPGRRFLADLSGVLAFATGAGLLWGATAALASRILFVYLALWLVLLKIPHIVMAPTVELNWNGTGEIAVVTAGGLVLFATLGGDWGGRALAWSRGDSGVRVARLLFAIAMPA
ncbi:MAG: DoxX family protein, partial [Deltaproteobacteria bacterium]